MQTYKGCLIQTKIVNGTKVFVFDNKPYPTKYLCEKAIEKSFKKLGENIRKHNPHAFKN